MSAACRVATGSNVDPVVSAAQWLATGAADKTKAVIPQIRSRFNLSAIEAVAAIRESNLILAGAT
ncbi:MAG: hypothetical protein E5X58_31125 [Mesorhizobium sp.]|nr:MAG: hypothetical protein E5X58_31125 [Mesorhizobium sp.]